MFLDTELLPSLEYFLFRLVENTLIVRLYNVDFGQQDLANQN